ncbi:MAG: hypothetical protein JWN43_3082, partial [Gammaproteobacteria bacterium]|nr:hypothetical protein [Gammaproteobacteria bacterium]
SSILVVARDQNDVLDALKADEQFDGNVQFLEADAGFELGNIAEVDPGTVEDKDYRPWGRVEGDPDIHDLIDDWNLYVNA